MLPQYETSHEQQPICKENKYNEGKIWGIMGRLVITTNKLAEEKMRIENKIEKSWKIFEIFEILDTNKF